MFWIILVIAVCIVVVITYIISSKRYYSSIFHETTFQKFYLSMSKAVMASVQIKGSDPSLDNDTAFVLSEGIAAGVTFDDKDGQFQLYISLSQPGRRTTTAVASRFGYFVLSMLNQNQAKLSPFVTTSGVHHLILTLETDRIALNGFDESYSEYNQHYSPIPFVADKSL